MTPKEKALEIANAMYNGSVFDKTKEQHLQELENAKRCALIAVDEKYSGIINVIVDLKGRGCIDDKTFLKALDDMNTEWEEVKQEIEKL